MTALAQEKARRSEQWKYKSFTLAAGNKAYKGARACLNSTGKVVPATSTTALKAIGVFAETVDATAAAAPVTVDLETELTVERFVNATAGDACAATDIGAVCYMLDDQTVTITATGRSVAGRIWDVDATKGVAVQKLIDLDLDLDADLSATPVAVAFVANAWAPTDIAMGYTYDIATTGAASVVTLPTAAADGTRAYFVADGTKNGHTVTYKDQAGATAITTALTASKRHLVTATKRDGLWFAAAYVSP